MKTKGLAPWGSLQWNTGRERGFFESAEDGLELKRQRPRLLLHSCCGPCSTSVIERLVSEYDVTVYFYNPNIDPEEEYQRRLASQIKFIEGFNQSRKALETEKGVLTFHQVEFIEGEYCPEDFYEVAQGFDNEPEGGQRCVECFRLRLEKTAKMARWAGFPIFATTLTVSPHKDYDVITEIGLYFGRKCGIEYLATDFKKKNGYARSIELSKEYGLYRQHYCGCEYSNTDTGKETDK